ncbi:hypothetical protein HQ39_05435 [Porphyromonas sp. COT-108 OH2963]|uniref:dynamin family protein n=1 Tax=Porphyromonas sp. COT-108 OH2963 TaxID=1515614 RepID=UPI00052CEEB6|nr:dynamin family protein [Porphyromonas sp. COT-108 OH2963]KGN95674.1 hypothetical protein HQ39_05435 [Porphyromonas sp. COT-108 OH2963]
MEQTPKNLLKNHYDKKQQVLATIDTALDYKWIAEDQANEIKRRIEDNILTIGVIGQMKSGKSTFLNTFVFEDDVLPSATTPMTAALSVITYGEEKSIEAEFYTKEEWEEQKAIAQSHYDESQEFSIKAAKIKAARELVENNRFSETELKELLGKKQTDNISQLIEYVGAKGKYVAITKAVKIYYPLEYLKGVEIVDTPGFNDPIVSREERTKDFLKNADVVLLLLYAGRPFDETDHNILFENVRESGIGKLIIGINKYDIAYETGEDTDNITKYVIDQVKKAAEKVGDETLKGIINEVTPIPISASMSLLSQLPMSKIQSVGEYKHAWQRLTDIFEISSQPELRQCSLIDRLFSSISTVISEEKENIMLRKPLNLIMVMGEKIKSDLIKSIHQNSQLIENLNASGDEIEDKLRYLNKLKRKLDLKIENFRIDSSSTTIGIVTKGKYNCEDIVDELHNRIDRRLEKVKRTSSLNENINSIDKEITHTLERELYRAIDEILRQVEKKMFDDSALFMDDTSTLFKHYIKDFEIEQILNPLKANLQLSCDVESIKEDPLKESESSISIIEVIAGILSIPRKILFDNKLGQLIFGVEDFKNNLRSAFNEIKDAILKKIDDIFNAINSERSRKTDFIREVLFTEIIAPLTEQIEEIQSGKINKEEAIKLATNQIEEDTKQLDIINQQIITIKNLV